MRDTGNYLMMKLTENQQFLIEHLKCCEVGGLEDIGLRQDPVDGELIFIT